MDRGKIIDTLGLVPGGELSITEMEFVQWGRDLEFGLRYLIIPVENLAEESLMLRLIFRDCREMKYRVYAHIAAHEMGRVNSTADVVEIHLGQSNHRKDAQILTNMFSISISYGEVLIEKDFKRYALSV